MSERVVQYIDRAMVGRRIEVGVYKNDKSFGSAIGRLSRVTTEESGRMSFFFEGGGNEPTIWFDTNKFEFLITWDPEERD